MRDITLWRWPRHPVERNIRDVTRNNRRNKRYDAVVDEAFVCYDVIFATLGELLLESLI